MYIFHHEVRRAYIKAGILFADYIDSYTNQIYTTCIAQFRSLAQTDAFESNLRRKGWGHQFNSK